MTTGASNDIEQATKIARAMITQYGMSEKFGLVGLESVQHRYLDGRPVMNCGEATASEIDAEVMRMLKEAYEHAKQLLTEHRQTLDEIAAFLIERETITGKEFMKIFRRVEGIPEPEENETSEEKGSRILMKEEPVIQGIELEEAKEADKLENQRKEELEAKRKAEENSEASNKEEDAAGFGNAMGESTAIAPGSETTVEENDPGEGSEDNSKDDSQNNPKDPPSRNRYTLVK